MSPPTHREISEKSLVLLGLIAEQPIHAYGIREKIERRRMTEWTDISFSSIYRVLADLEKQQLIAPNLVHEGQGATKKVYSLTQTGRDALERGLLQHLSTKRFPRDPFQVGLAFIQHAPPEKLRTVLRQRKQTIERWRSEVTQHHRAATHAMVGKPLSVAPGIVGTDVHPAFEHVLLTLNFELSYVDKLLDQLGHTENESALPGDAPDQASRS